MRTLSLCGAAALALAIFAAPIVAAAEEAQPEDLVNALNGVFGAHAGKRAAHTKGICLKGNFTPTAEAATLSKAPHFASAVPVTARFSLGGGNPAASDKQKDNARGLAVHFDLGKGNTTDLVMISAPVFVAKTPEQFVTLLKTVAPGPDGKQDADKIAAFFKANPEFDPPGRVAQRAPGAGKLRDRAVFCRARVHRHQRQGREARRQVEVRAGQGRAGLER